MRTQTNSIIQILAALAAFCLLIAPPLSAQNSQPQAAASAPQPPHRLIRAKRRHRRPQVAPGGKGTIRSTVSLVEIDVQVTDRDGKPIKGLKQEQFTVTEDGKPQKVSTFEYNDIEKLKPPARPPRRRSRFRWER
jgi:hypothetical protein